VAWEGLRLSATTRFKSAHVLNIDLHRKQEQIRADICISAQAFVPSNLALSPGEGRYSVMTWFSPSLAVEFYSLRKTFLRLRDTLSRQRYGSKLLKDHKIE
jgi:hypothetical protein